MCKLFRKFLAASAAAILLSMPISAHASSRFEDVNPNKWYYTAVDYAATEGLFNGTSPTTFDPDGSMTRGMFVTVLANKTNGYNAAPYGASSFTDVPASQWYAAPVEWAYQSKLVGGMGNGKFAPNASVTREQIAKILYDYAQRTGNDTTSDPAAMQGFADADKVSRWARQAMEWATTHKVIKSVKGGFPAFQGRDVWHIGREISIANYMKMGWICGKEQSGRPSGRTGKSIRPLAVPL